MCIKCSFVNFKCCFIAFFCISTIRFIAVNLYKMVSAVGTFQNYTQGHKFVQRGHTSLTTHSLRGHYVVLASTCYVANVYQI